MRCRLSRFPLTKAVPLAISRGTTAAVEHLLLEVEHDGLTGLGETGGFDTGHRAYATDDLAAELEALLPALEGLIPNPCRPSNPCWRGCRPPPAAPWIWPCTTGGASGWASPCGGSGAWTTA